MSDKKAEILDNDIYKPKKHLSGFNKGVYAIYFYYIGKYREGDGKDKDGRPNPHIRHYYDFDAHNAIGYDDVVDRIKTLAYNAMRIDEKLQQPPPEGANLKFIVWTRRSYVVFLWDDEDIVLQKEGELVINPDGDGLANHTFFDGSPGAVDVTSPYGDVRKCKFVFCINHMKKEGGGPIERQFEYFKFRLGAKSEKDGRDYPQLRRNQYGSARAAAVWVRWKRKLFHLADIGDSMMAPC